MAAIGQGDPRWIVAQREDGKNVNNWHWTETDYTSWVKNRLTELVIGQNFTTPNGEVQLKTLKINGEVSVNTRKQKVIFFYELDITISWQGKLSDTEDVKGTVLLPYISEENDDDDFEVKLTVEDEKDDRKYKVMDSLRSQVIPFLKQKLPQMLEEMRKTSASKQLLPAAKAPAPSPANIDINDKDAVAELVNKLPELNKPVVNTTKTSTPSTTASTKTRTSTVNVTEKFVCGAEELYMSLIDPNRVKAYAGGDAEMKSEVGGKFKLFGGYVTGENVSLERPNKIVQKWRMSNWPEGHYSNVIFDIEQKESKVHLKLTQTDVPESEKQTTQAGWSSNYFNRIKGIFGFGAAF